MASNATHTSLWLPGFEIDAPAYPDLFSSNDEATAPAADLSADSRESATAGTADDLPRPWRPATAQPTQLSADIPTITWLSPSVASWTLTDGRNPPSPCFITRASGSVLLTLAGIIVGITFSLLARIGIEHRWPLVHIDKSVDWMIRATIVALAGAAAGAIYPAYKAAQKDPIDALAYE